MVNEHILSSFDDDLHKLNKDLLKLAKLATEQFVNSIDNFSTQNIEEIDKLISKDKNLDDLDEKIQQLGFEIIALRAPQAEDLRRVISALKISTVLERIGDYSRNISNRTKALCELSSDDIPGVNIGKMGLVTQEMLEDVIIAYKDKDSDLSVKVRDTDVVIDKMNTKLYQEVLASMSRNKKNIVSGTHILFIAKSIERVGDYVTDIAEQNYFLINGKPLSEERPKADKTSLYGID